MLLLSSCGDWLNVVPKSDITGEKLFDNEEGYYSALAGIYTKMISTEAYGGALTFEHVERMGNALTSGMAGNNAEYFYDYYPQNFRYLYFFMFATSFDKRSAANSDQMEKTVTNIWTTLYNSIANANILLEELEASGDGDFPAGVRSMLIGETLALKAYAHFDLMRLFQPPYKSEVGKTAKRIPYMAQTTRDFVPSATSDEFLTHILADLDKAAELLKEYDPICTDKTYTTDMFAGNRQYKMNYYAVKALSARVRLYRATAEDMQQAYDDATEVIRAAEGGQSGIRFVTESDLTSTDSQGYVVNRAFPTEFVFALRSEQLSSQFYAVARNNSAYYGSYGYYEYLAIRNEKEAYYYPNGNDLRRKYWFSTKMQSGSRTIDKWYQPSTNASDLALYPKQSTPMIRLGEVYLIAAEAAAELGKSDALTWLNTLQRAHKGNEFAGTAKQEILDEILLEYRRELLGEGQLFYAYKRRNAPKIEKGYYHGTGDVYWHTMTDKMYTMDIPLDEYNGGRTYDAL